jgi:hypothetical protein
MRPLTEMRLDDSPVEELEDDGRKKARLDTVSKLFSRVAKP